MALGTVIYMAAFVVIPLYVDDMDSPWKAVPVVVVLSGIIVLIMITPKHSGHKENNK